MRVLPWLEVAYEFDKETSLILVMHLLEDLFVNFFDFLFVFLLIAAGLRRRYEIALVLFQEVVEEVLDDDLALYSERQLLHESQILIRLHGVQPVAVPGVVKEVLYLRYQLLVQRVAIIES